MADDTTWIDPKLIKPLHAVKNLRHFEELAGDMKENGWHGRPLLVIERENDYLAWTGSHRIAAAIEAGFETVPCYVLAESELLEHDVDAERGHVEDYERLAILRKVGDNTAMNLMWQETQLID